MLVTFAFILFFKFCEAVTSLGLTAIFIPVAAIFYVLNECVRAVISLVIYCQHGSKAKLVSNGLDNIWGYKTPEGGNSRNVLFLAVYEERIDGYRYRSKFLNEVLPFVAPDGTRPYLKLKKVFTKKFGYYCWKDDENFDIANHVIVYPDEKVVTESDMLLLLNDLSKDMDESKPQWQEIIISRFQYDRYRGTPDGGNENGKIQSARILRFHHSFGDAGSWLLLYSYCMAGGSIPFAVNPLKGFPVPAWQQYLYYINAIVFGATTALKAAWNGQMVNNRLVTRRYNGEKYFAWTDEMDLNVLKEIKMKTKSNIPTVLASTVAGAIRSYDRAFPTKRGGIGNETEMGAVAALLPYPSFHLQNRFTIFNFPVPTGDMTALARLRLTHEKGLAYSTCPEPLVNFYLFNFFGRFPCFLQNMLMGSCGTSMIFSNLPGASETFKLWDDAIHDGGAWIPLLTVAG